jgi:hypothetical protein
MCGVWDQLVQRFQALFTSIFLNESDAHDDSDSDSDTDRVLVIAHDRGYGSAGQEEQDERLLELFDEAQP